MSPERGELRDRKIRGYVAAEREGIRARGVFLARYVYRRGISPGCKFDESRRKMPIVGIAAADAGMRV